MDYIELDFRIGSGEERDRLIAGLSIVGAEAFEETDELLKAFFTEADFAADEVRDLAAESGISYSIEQIAPENWNAVWESSFEPVTVPGFCTIRAGFHPPDTLVDHEIIITPKMSFGTGHHATTRLMIQAMCHIPAEGKSVLDFGTGTGILAILAHQLGALDILAIDNDEWSVENAVENFKANNSEDIRMLQGSLEVAGDQTFDIILANINRHILLRYMSGMRAMLAPGGTLVVSGILREDEEIITESASNNGFIQAGLTVEGNWICLIFTV